MNAHAPHCRLWPARLNNYTLPHKRHGVRRSVWPVLIGQAGEKNTLRKRRRAGAFSAPGHNVLLLFHIGNAC